MCPSNAWCSRPSLVSAAGSSRPARAWRGFPSARSRPPRDTAGAVTLAMERLRREDPRAVVGVFPADHRVADIRAFSRTLGTAARAAREGALVILGVRPDRPATGFGYVEAGSADGGVLPVRRFVEKPDAAAAAEYLAGGRHFWNAGIFIWQAEVFRRAMDRHAPQVASAVERYVDSGRFQEWEQVPRTSIDYALLERAGKVVLVPLEAGWSDIGGWEAVAALAARGDAGPAVCLEVRGEGAGDSVVLRLDGAGGRAVVLGEGGRMVVIGPEGVLVCPRHTSQRVKDFLS
ncbi:MAG: sugar phosphate nucleotidyltransferase [Acidobacteriota bacterium]|nr:sugar phosphate nucleotidyltransferase [Acidobacteriota bacterium]